MLPVATTVLWSTVAETATSTANVSRKIEANVYSEVETDSREALCKQPLLTIYVRLHQALSELCKICNGLYLNQNRTLAFPCPKTLFVLTLGYDST